MEKPYLKPEQLTAKVLGAYSAIANPRVRELIQALIKHWHAFVIEAKLSESEWEYAWQFLTQMAEMTHQGQNEFILAADVLGVSQLIEMINHPPEATQVGYALLGPFYRENPPWRDRGAFIGTEDTEGERVFITGKVVNASGQPIANAVVDVWQAATNGFYENQDPNQTTMNLRGRFKTDNDGTYELFALMPTPYPVPTNGPIGDLLAIANRHPYRPAHIHFIVSAPDFETLVTQVFVAGDKIIATDVVFTAMENMIGHFKKAKDYFLLEYDFQLIPGESTYPEAPVK
ncbi:MAG TPA: dioxygenase [Gammaproteobacteria bacterium]|nr:dioxygenase [Gammaproteobacteria bacterium]